MASTASAISYNVEVRDLGVLWISGMFDMDSTTTFNMFNVTNWMFTAHAPITGPDPAFTIASTDRNSELAIFNGSVASGLQSLFVSAARDSTCLGCSLTIGFSSSSVFSLQQDLSGEVITNCTACTSSITPKPANAPIPEPSTYLLFGTGLLGLALYRWRQGRAVRPAHISQIV